MAERCIHTCGSCVATGDPHPNWEHVSIGGCVFGPIAECANHAMKGRQCTASLDGIACVRPFGHRGSHEMDAAPVEL